MSAVHSLIIAVVIVFCAACESRQEAAPQQEEPLAVKLVVVTMFERGADEGDAPGEFQFWKERRDLDQRFAFPQSHHDLFYNSESRTAFSAMHEAVVPEKAVRLDLKGSQSL